MAARALCFQTLHLARSVVVQHAPGVADRTEDGRRTFGANFDDAPLQRLVGTNFARHQEAAPHHHAVGAQRQGRCNLPPAADAAAKHERQADLFQRESAVDESGQRIGAGMAALLAADQRDGIDAQARRALGVAHAGALVHQQAAAAMDGLDERFGRIAGTLEMPHAFRQRHLDPARHLRVRARTARQRQVDAEGPAARERAALAQVGAEVIERVEGTGGDEAHRAGVDYRRDDVRLAQVVHAAQQDRMMDTEQFGDSGAKDPHGVRTLRAQAP
ncbi:hypothetical protein D3C85_1231490 [compost metagenome]